MAKDGYKTVELANVVVNFGNKGLIENLKDRFLPAIGDQPLPGRGEVNEYRFLGIKFDEITPNRIPVMFGRLVKIMTIVAEQEFDEQKDELIDSSKQIPSAPSSFFVINLVNHRMAYMGETRRSPSLRDFESCIQRLLTKNWKLLSHAHLKAILAEEKQERIPRKKSLEYHKRVLIKVPKPEVRVTPLPALTEIDKKFEAFAKLKTVTIKPMKTNNELPGENATFLRKYAEQQGRIGSTSSKIDLTNSAEGLEKEEAQKLVKVAADGNFKVSMKGVARNGDKISGDLEELSVKLSEKIPDQESGFQRAVRLFNKMEKAFQDGYVIATSAVDDLLDKAREVVRSINGGNS